MKRSGKRLLAWVLCLAMALTLLPMAALARWDDEELPAVPAEQTAQGAHKAELPADAPEDGGDSADLTQSTIPTDGAVADTWTQTNSAVTGSTCEKTSDGKLHLTPGSNVSNNGDSDPGPAVFASQELNAVLATNQGETVITFDVKPLVSNLCFGVYFNYQNPANGMFIGYNGSGSTWFWQGYYPNAGSSNWGNINEGVELSANQTYHVEFKWNPTTASFSLKVGDTVILDSTSATNAKTHYDNLIASTIGSQKSFGIKLGKYTSGTIADAEISNFHYTGQATQTVYDITGTVKSGNQNLAGVTVSTQGNKTATTEADGTYTISGLTNGDYTLTYTKDGYGTESQDVTVSNADVTAPEMSLEESDLVQIPTDGVNNGDWTQVGSTKLDTTAVEPTVVNGELVLTAGRTNGHKLSAATKTAVFTSAKMTEALGKVSGERTVSFTLTPECGKAEGKSNVTDYIAFGIVLNASGDNTGYGISYSNEDTGDAGKWLIQQFDNGTGGGYGTPTDLLPTVGQPMDFEITWTDSAVTIKINGQTLSHQVGMGNVARTNTVAFTLGGKDYNDDQIMNEPRPTRIRISNLHYSGQEEVSARYVSGTVKCGNQALAKAEVSVTGVGNEAYKTSTEADGSYKLAVPVSDTAYTLQAEKDGYTTGSNSVTVTAAVGADTLKNVNFALTELPKITGKVVDKNNKPLRASVSSDRRVEDKKPAAVCDEDGNFTIIGAKEGKHTLTISLEGYETTTKEVTVGAVGTADVDAGTIQLPDRVIPFYTLSTEDMDVRVAKGFPQVIDYTMKKLVDENNEPLVMLGQTAELKTIRINGAIESKTALGVEIAPKVTSVLDASGKKVTYTMVIDETNNNGSGVTATITAELRVGLDDVNDAKSASAGRTLGFYITGVTYPKNDRVEHPVDNIEIPNHSLVSVRSTQTGANVSGGKLASNTIATGDKHYTADGEESLASAVSGYKEDFFAAFVYNNNLSAGLASNSAYGTGTAGSGTYPVRVQFEAKDGDTTASIGLGSTLWYYDHDITRDEDGGDAKLTETQLSKAERIIAPLETPFAKVVIAGDENGNGKVDWQDSAIAYRETVMHIPAGGEGVADAVNLRISMNFGSMATNPFLIALDNVKRVAAHTDGLGQFVLLKGYAGEGHDSNHPQYDNIGIRMGGPEDLKTLMTEGEKLGAVFGIHTNASEFYAEAITNEDQVRRKRDTSMHYGWNWIDQGIAINGVYDYAKGLQIARWNKLYNIVKGHPFVVYVDVWGNNTSGTENDFMTRALSQNIVGNGHDGWRIAHEWSYGNPYESTFQHWVTDYTYGDYNDKGKLNSNVMRFLLNQYKDSFTPDFAAFGGAANAPLLGGPAMQGFEGWQGDGEYNLSIYNTFNQMIYTKFLQHYGVTEWTNATAAVAMPWAKDAGGAHDGVDRVNEKNVKTSGTANWIPEVQLKLAGDGDEIVVTRGTTGELVTDFGLDTAEKFLAGETTYRSRVVTLNDKKIVEGAPASAGEDNTFPKSKSTLKYLIPWYWNAKGERLTNVDDQKLYHWNAKGGESTWQLQDDWNDLTSVMVYELSDQGRGIGVSVPVNNGSVTLTAKAETCYVVTRGATKAAAPKITYGTGLHLEDPSFNLDTAKGPWTVEGKGSAVHTTNPDGIGILKMVGEVSVSQQFNDLKAGTKYVTYAAIDNRSDAKVTMTITDNTGKVVATNYTKQSIARNYISSYYLHNNHGAETGGSYFQNMFLYFTPQSGKTYTLTISREAGRGNAYVDDIRTVEYGFNYSGFGAGQTAQTKSKARVPVTYVTDASGNATSVISSLYQDFENVPQGIWPFVVGPAENVADNRVHVSELNTPFTQAGWDVKKMDDVIDGNWSIKVNGLSGRQNLIYQTIPQNFRFEPDSVYTVEFDYELGSAGSYVAVVGDGAYTGLDGLTVINLDETLLTNVPAQSNANNGIAKANVGHAKFTVVGSASGQTWIGIYSKDNADNKGTSGSASAFGGYLDFVLDNLSIELALAAKNALALKLQEADPMVTEVYTENEQGAWNAFVAARAAAHTVFEDGYATQAAVEKALNDLITAMEKLTKAAVSISGTVKNANNALVEGVELTLEDANYFPVGLTVTTGADGAFTFVSKSGVELLPGTYHIKAQATGYNVTTTGNIVVDKTATTVTGQNITLEAEAPGAYVNDFNQCLDDGQEHTSYGPMDNLLTEEEAEGKENELPTMQWVEYNGSGALKVIWHATTDEVRHTNNVVDKTVSFKNGSASFDVTALTTGVRFNVTLRGISGGKRVAIGQQDDPKKWMGEFWNTDGSGYSVTTPNVLAVEPGVTRNVRVVANNTTFTVYIDGIQAYEVDASNGFTNAYGPLGTVPVEAGYVGINARYQNGAEFILDNIRIIRADAAADVQNVSGTVTARSGVAVSGAAVELFDGDTRVAGTTTNALGEYQISRVAPKSYTMKVSAPFFQGQEESVIVVNGTDLTGKNFTLIPDISSLTTLIAEVEALEVADYTAETWADLQTALTAAKAINDQSTIAQLNTAYRDLSNAKAALELAPLATADFSELRALINEMAQKEKTGYTAESWTAFQNKLTEAQTVLGNGNATQDEINAAKDTLQSAYDALELVTIEGVDLDALREAYDAAKDLQSEDYTEGSWTAFDEARTNALAMLNNVDVQAPTQAEVDETAKALTDAQAALVKKSGGNRPSTSTPTTPSETTTTQVKEDGTKVTTITKPDGTVTEIVEQPDGTKSETVTTKEGDVTITVTDENGEELVKAEIPATIPEPETKFEDVDATPWADEAIHKMAGLELVNGTGGNKYSPIAPMTRGSLATVLHRLSQGKTDYENTFKDVAQGKYYSEGVAWAAKANVVKGISEDIFAPDRTITREQLAVMLARYAKLIGMDTKADAKALEAFTDGENTGSWAIDGVAWCVENGILKGKGQNNLDPTENVTRAEVAVMLDRFIGLIQK